MSQPDDPGWPTGDVNWTYSERAPVELHDGYVAVAGERVPFYSAHIDDVLGSYVRLVRTLRGAPEGAALGFRRVDIDALAVHFGWASLEVVTHLGEVVGASHARLQSMRTSYTAGASVINSGSGKPASSTRLQQMLLGASSPPE